MSEDTAKALAMSLAVLFVGAVVYLFIALLIAWGNGISAMNACTYNSAVDKSTNNTWQANPLTLGTTGICMKGQ